MRKLLVVLGALLAVSLIAGCRTAQIREMQNDDMAMVYGHLKSSPALTDVYFINRDKVTVGRTRYRAKVYPGGTYVIENVPPGRYFIGAYVTGGRYFLWFKHETEEAADKHTVVVKPGSLNYLGSYEVTNEEISRWTKSGSFELAVLKSPGEKEILHQVLPLTAGTRWEARIQARLKKLK